jgi:hypothetical protein
LLAKSAHHRYCLIAVVLAFAAGCGGSTGDEHAAAVSRDDPHSTDGMHELALRPVTKPPARPPTATADGRVVPHVYQSWLLDGRQVNLESAPPLALPTVAYQPQMTIALNVNAAPSLLQLRVFNSVDSEGTPAGKPVRGCPGSRRT